MKNLWSEPHGLKITLEIWIFQKEPRLAEDSIIMNNAL